MCRLGKGPWDKVVHYLLLNNIHEYSIRLVMVSVLFKNCSLPASVIGPPFLRLCFLKIRGVETIVPVYRHALRRLLCIKLDTLLDEGP